MGGEGELGQGSGGPQKGQEAGGEAEEVGGAGQGPVGSGAEAELGKGVGDALVESALAEVGEGEALGGDEVLDGRARVIESGEAALGEEVGEMGLAVAAKADEVLGHGVGVKAAGLEEEGFADGEVAAKDEVGADGAREVAEVEEAEVAAEALAVGLGEPEALDPVRNRGGEEGEAFAADESDLGVGEGAEDGLEPERGGDDVVIGKDEERGLGAQGAEVAADMEARGGIAEEEEMGEAWTEGVTNGGGVVGGAIIDDEGFKVMVGKGLGAEGLEGAAEGVGAVPGGDDDGKVHQATAALRKWEVVLAMNWGSRRRRQRA